MSGGLRQKRTQKSRKATTKIDESVEINKLKYKEERKIFYCTACGKDYNKQNTNFIKSQSPLFAGNNGFVPICKKCIDKYYYNLVDFFKGNEEKAMDRCASLLDLYYRDDIFAATRKVSADKSRIGSYPAKMNLQNFKATGKTYLDTIADRVKETIISSEEDIAKMKEEGRSNITKTMFERWGQVSPEDIVALEEHYKMLKKQNPNCDNNQEIFIKDLCYIKILQMKAFRDNESADFEKHTKLYRETFKQSGLKIAQEDDASVNNTLGVNAELISQHTPEEFYKDKQLYKDFDGLGEYFERFVRRPLKNLQFNGNERDFEYNVGDSNGNEEDY